MSSNREYVAIVKRCQQIGPDDYEMQDEVMKLTDQTTVGQIREWYQKIFPVTGEGGAKMVAVRLAQLDPLPEPPNTQSLNQ